MGKAWAPMAQGRIWWGGSGFGQVRPGAARCGEGANGAIFVVRLGWAGLGPAWQGTVWQGQVWQGEGANGAGRIFCGLGKPRPDMACCGLARYGGTGPGEAGPGKARAPMAQLGCESGRARQAAAWRGGAGYGLVRGGAARVGKAGRGPGRVGLGRRGSAGDGLAWAPMAPFFLG